MEHVQKVTKYFNYHQKSKAFFRKKKISQGATQDRLHVLNHDIPTRWHSLLSSMLTYITEIDNISSVVSELDISHYYVPPMHEEQQKTLVESATQ